MVHEHHEHMGFSRFVWNRTPQKKIHCFHWFPHHFTNQNADLALKNRAFDKTIQPFRRGTSKSAAVVWASSSLRVLMVMPMVDRSKSPSPEPRSPAKSWVGIGLMSWGNRKANESYGFEFWAPQSLGPIIYSYLFQEQVPTINVNYHQLSVKFITTLLPKAGSKQASGKTRLDLNGRRIDPSGRRQAGLKHLLSAFRNSSLHQKIFNYITDNWTIAANLPICSNMFQYVPMIFLHDFFNKKDDPNSAGRDGCTQRPQKCRAAISCCRSFWGSSEAESPDMEKLKDTDGTEASLWALLLLSGETSSIHEEFETDPLW